MYADYFHISPGQGAAGDMSAFGAAQTKLRVEYDARLRDEIIRWGESSGLRVGTLGQRDPSLDHGTFVPLYFLREAVGGLLPDLVGVVTVEQQIDIARQKGGISFWEKYTLERFEVVRHT